MRLNLFAKFVILLVLLAVIPAAIVGLRTIKINQEGMQTAILELHTNTATYLANDIQKFLQSLEREIQYILRTLSAEMTWNDRQAVLQALLDTNENFVSVAIVDKKGSELLKAYNPALEKDPRLASKTEDPTFIKFWGNPKTSSISETYFSGDEPRINIIYPLGANHCLYSTVSLRILWDDIARTRIASTGYAFIVNNKGEIIAHRDVELAKKKSSALDLIIVQQLLKAVSTGSSEYMNPKTKKKMVGAYAPVKGLNWGVIIQQEKHEAYLSVYRMQKQAGILILISIGAATLLALSIARGLTNPIVKIIEAAKHVANKDFSQRVTVNTKDELQDLAEMFNEMTAELDRYNKMQIDKIIEEKTKTEAVIFSIPDGILVTDREGKIQLANKLTKEVLGLGDSDFQNQELSTVVKNVTIRDALDGMIKQNTQNVNGKEVDLSTKDLIRYYLLKAQEVISPQNNEKIGLVTVIRNITLEKELSRMKDDFLHSITHDLRNPMTSIRGFLKFLLDGVAGPVTPQQQKMLGVMDHASLKLLSLINDILDIAKLEAGRMTINLVEIDLRTVAQHSIEIGEGLALKKTIAIRLESRDDLPKIKCDPDLIERVFSNLLGNALKFTPEKGTVTIRLNDLPDNVEVCVQDTGEGIPAEYVHKIFDKFQQVAGQRKGGTGLGLTICKHIIGAHMGRIWAESKLGEGAKFFFTIPKNLAFGQGVIIQVPKKN